MGTSLVSWTKDSVAETALVCIPWAGAGAAPFRVWAPVLGDTAAVYGTRLAGRESRQTEPPATDLADVVAELVRDVTALGVPRVALYGQCSGAVLAFETAHALRAAGPEVAGLVVASQIPPRALAAAPVESGDDLVRYVAADLRDEPELLDVLLPILAADMSLIAHYAHTPAEPLDVPLTVVYGGRDDQLGRAEVTAWRDETTGPTAFHEIPDADHLFGGPAWPALAEVVRQALT